MSQLTEEYKQKELQNIIDQCQQAMNILYDTYNKAKSLLDNSRNNKNKSKAPHHLLSEEWKQLIDQFIQENNRLPTVNERYQGYGIGVKLVQIKLQRTPSQQYLYKWLQQKYPQYIYRSPNPTTYNQYKDLFQDFINQYNRLPYNTESYKHVFLGLKLQDVIQQKTEIDKQLYEWLDLNHHTHLMAYKLHYIDIDSEQEQPNSKEQQKFRKWQKIIISFVNQHNRLPKSNEKYMKYNIGRKVQQIKAQRNEQEKQLYQWICNVYGSY